MRTLIIILAAGALFSDTPTLAAPVTTISLDGSLGQAAQNISATSPHLFQIAPPSVGMPGYQGANLFESFGTFNLGTGDTASFQAYGNTQNILARVTGGSTSSIDGKLQSPVNLFLINPAGVMFGANAEVDVTGAFVVSTANYAKLSDGNFFYADVNHVFSDQGLTSAPISAFGFLTATPSPIGFAGTSLSAATGTGLQVIAGDITLTQGTDTGGVTRGTTLSAPSGLLTLFSAASVGEVPFNLNSSGAGFAHATNTSFGHIAIQNKSKLAIDGGGGGQVVIRSGQLVVDNSTISSANSGSVAGGDISVQTSSLTAQNGGRIVSSTSGAGAGGAISVQTDSASFDGATILSTSNDVHGNPVATVAPSGISSQTSGAGNGGAVNVIVTGGLSFTNGGQISSGSSGGGKGGDLIVQASLATIDGVARNSSGNPVVLVYYYSVFGPYFSIEAAVDSPSGITSQASGTGNGGAIGVTVAGSLGFTNSGQIRTITGGAGNGGAISVAGDTISINGYTSDNLEDFFSSGVFSYTYASFNAAAGNGGALHISASGEVSLSNLGKIVADTSSLGDGGAITVDAGTVTIDSGSIVSNTGSSGNGGDIIINAGTITLGGPTQYSFVDNAGIFSDSPGYTGTSPISGGNAGSVTVNVSQLDILGKGEISTETQSSGSVGSITVTADSAVIDGSTAIDYNTGIFSDAQTSTNSGETESITLMVSGQLSIVGCAKIDSSSSFSGSVSNITIDAGSLLIDGSASTTFGTGIEALAYSTNAGEILVDVQGQMTMEGLAVVQCNTSGAGNAGKVIVEAGALNMSSSAQDVYLSGIASQANPNSTGNAGDVTVTVQDALNITSHATISAATFGAGKGGDVMVNAGSLTIDGSATPESATGILSDTYANATGIGGNVVIKVQGQMTIDPEGEVDSNTFGAANAGTVSVQAGSLSIIGAVEGPTFTGIASGAFSGAAGNAGSINLTVNNALNVSSSGEITTSTTGAGEGGSIIIHAGSLTIDGSATPAFFTGISSSCEDGATGNGGQIQIVVKGSLTIDPAGELDSSTSGLGNGGTVSVQAGSLSIAASSDDPYLTGISSEANPGSTGNAGDLTLNISGAISLSSNGEISTETDGAGAGGDVTISANSINLEGATFSDSGHGTGISASSQNGATGNGGALALHVTNGLTLTNGAVIEASSQNTNAGSIMIDAANLSLMSGSSINTSAGNSGGNITLRIGGVVYLFNSDLSAAAGGNGGNIAIDPEFVVLDNGLISANAAQGLGGNITIITSNFLNDNSLITATGSTNGTIDISAPDLDLSGSLIALPAPLESDEKRLKEKCARSVNHEFSSFIVVGRGGMESAPEELQPDFGMGSLPDR